MASETASETVTQDQPEDVAAPAPRRSMWRVTMRLGRSVLRMYLLLILLMMLFETYLIFPTWQIPPGDWNPTGFAFEDVTFDSEDGTQLNGWYFEHTNPRAYVLYCHGNGENLAHMGDYLDALREEYQISIFAFDYRGYGKSAGKPCESGVLADGRAAEMWLARRAKVKPDQIVLWGRSIGGAVAVRVATDLGARAMILERTFTSLPDVAARHYPWLPVRRLMRNRFDSLACIGDYHGPLLQSHGTADEIVPFALGKQLFEAAESTDKQFVAMPGVTHNAPNTEDYYTQLRRFLGKLP